MEPPARSRRNGTSACRSSSGGAALSRETMKLLDALARGIDPTRCATSSRWSRRIGNTPSRPCWGAAARPSSSIPHASTKPSISCGGTGTSTSGCTLVKTTQTRSIDSRRSREHPRGGHVRGPACPCVPERPDWRVHEGGHRVRSRSPRPGVMRNGKTSSGMGLSVQRNLRELILGRAARERSARHCATP